MTRSLLRVIFFNLFVANFWFPAFAYGQKGEISFARHVLPILTAKCQGCHLPTMRSGGLLVTSYADFKKGGRHGTPFVPGQPEQSLLLKHLTGEIEPRMPMGMTPLSAEEIDLFRGRLRGSSGHGSHPCRAPGLSGIPRHNGACLLSRRAGSRGLREPRGHFPSRRRHRRRRTVGGPRGAHTLDRFFP